MLSSMSTDHSLNPGGNTGNRRPRSGIEKALDMARNFSIQYSQSMQLVFSLLIQSFQTLRDGMGIFGVDQVRPCLDRVIE